LTYSTGNNSCPAVANWDNNHVSVFNELDNGTFEGIDECLR